MSHPEAPTPRSPRLLPWRSVTDGWLVAVLALAVGLPLFLSMPPWNDVTLHDMAVRAMLRGGVHYRDVFDTNLPGIDWAMAAVRRLFGWSYAALRVADLVVIAAEVWLLAGWVRKGGGAGYTVAWLVAAAAMFYPFTSEFNHAQRDPWLLLPALVAARMRVARVGRTNAPSALAILEGLAWGAAVWVKPHVMVPAAALWAVSAVLIARREPRRNIPLDLAGLVLGGILAGLAGVAWLVGTGAWPHFLDVFTNWNPGYMKDVWGGIGDRFVRTFRCFRPWSLLHLAAIPLAVLALRNLRRPVRLPRWLYAPAETEAVAAARALLAAFYLGWLAQGVVLQKGFDYVQVPLLFLAMAVVGTHRWAFGFAYLVWFAVTGVLLNTVLPVPPGATGPGVALLRVEHQPFTDPKILKLWPRCWREGGSPELRDRLGQYTDAHCGTNWEELTAVAGFLKTIDPPLGPRELNCWHDSTHPLYLMLDLEPATRYMHYGTVFPIRSQRDRIAAEVAGSPQRYVVSDLMRMTYDRNAAYAPGAGGDPRRYAPWFPVSQRDKFPWNQPVVFRSGRYLVHKVVNPLGEIDIPDYWDLDKLGPGE